ncbi:MAG: glyceraldehyde 3-phosphate dehydrogenase NAD-binding domain-containing protein, partial [Cyanobacteria bacterium P01_C01_bin.73]
MIRVAINGFGRIGRNFVRCLLTRENSQLQLAAINDTSDPKTNAHLLRYDSMLGRLDADIVPGDDTLTVNGNVIKCCSDRNPNNLPWKEWEIDLVIECTGVFRSAEGAGRHIQAGAKKVLITAPGKGADIGTYVVGVNHEQYTHDAYDVLSNASCTTNCLAPVVKVINETFGIIKGTMTTTHSYTGDQRLLDAS